MKDFEKLIEQCMSEVIDAGIKPAKKIKWRINTRARKTWGTCTYHRSDNSYVIQISATLIMDDRVSEEACKTTMIHEILHTCKNSMNHTGNWKKNAAIMNVRYGYRIKRTTSGEEKGVENYTVTRRLPIKYVFRCRGCGQIIMKKKACKFTKYYRNYTCGICYTPRAFLKVSD